MNKKTTIYFDEELHKNLKLMAVQTDKSFNELLAEILKEGYEKRKKEMSK